MNIDIAGIAQGVKNSIFIKEEIEKLSQYRLSICETCEHYSPNIKKRGLQIFRRDKFCNDCQCNMFLKTRYVTAECPLGGPKSNYPLEKPKWLAISNDDKLAEELLETPELKQKLIDYKIQLSQGKIDEHNS